MSTIVQWIHLSAAVLGVGGIAFLHIVFLPAAKSMNPEQRDALLKHVMGKFRWVSWSAILLLIVSGVYNVRQYYWEVPWGIDWFFLALKIFLALLVFIIAFALSLPFKFLDWFRARRQMWLSIALTLAMIVILISAHLRRD